MHTECSDFIIAQYHNIIVYKIIYVVMKINHQLVLEKFEKVVPDFEEILCV